MAHDDQNASAAALREIVSGDLQTNVAAAQRCVERIESVLFERRALAPAESILARVTELLRKDLDGHTIADDELLTRHDELCARLAADFAMNADCWDDPITASYRSRAAVAFGIEESGVPTLFREFHILSESTRLGIFIAIEKAPLFSYLTREIDAYEGTVTAGHPTSSLRGLMAKVFASE
jgi:hypothetical protein